MRLDFGAFQYSDFRISAIHCLYLPNRFLFLCIGELRVFLSLALTFVVVFVRSRLPFPFNPVGLAFAQPLAFALHLAVLLRRRQTLRQTTFCATPVVQQARHLFVEPESDNRR